MKYEYIIGGRLRNKSRMIKNQILGHPYSDATIRSYDKNDKTRPIVHYSKSRATKDAHSRKRGLKHLEKKVETGKLTKSSINNKGYNKYLKLAGEVSIEIDYEKYDNDNKWDGLKGYVANTRLTDQLVLDNHKNLWHIEKAFRMSKTDLRIPPVYHRLRKRIEAHICLSFTAYCIYKELERVLYKTKSKLSLRKAADLTHNTYQITCSLPESKHTKSILLNMDENQTELCKIINENF